MKTTNKSNQCKKDNIDDRLAICLKTVRINKTNNKYKGVKNE